MSVTVDAAARRHPLLSLLVTLPACQRRQRRLSRSPRSLLCSINKGFSAFFFLSPLFSHAVSKLMLKAGAEQLHH